MWGSSKTLCSSTHSLAGQVGGVMRKFWLRRKVGRWVIQELLLFVFLVDKHGGEMVFGG